MLIERGAEPPPVVYPPKTNVRRDSSVLEEPATQEPRKRTKSNDSYNIVAVPIAMDRNQDREFHVLENHDDSFETLLNNLGGSVSDLPVFEFDPPRNSDLLGRLLSNKGHLGIDQQSGQEHYYGSTT